MVSIVREMLSFSIELEREFLICVMVEQSSETSCLMGLDPYSEERFVVARGAAGARQVAYLVSEGQSL